jgi:hypothetical protein
MARVARPDTATVTLTNGDRLVLAKRLNAGQELDAFVRTVKSITSAGVREFHPDQLTTSKMVAYLVNWFLTDDDTGEPLDLPIYDSAPSDVEAALRKLDGATFREIRDAIDVHAAKMDAEVAAQKKILSGSPASSPSTASAASPDGPGTKSEPSLAMSMT